uniref:Uncharacterized protein n=1 Tax=viral metagenome TaxID=1070528 RepID=A0A6C0IXS2_9ZZZZ
MGNALGITEVSNEVAKDDEEKTGGMETSRTATTTLSDSSSPTEIISYSETESPSLVLASMIPDDFYHLLEEAIATCEKHERIDIILTYLCNLQATPKEVGEIATDLKHIAHLQDSIKSTFVPIRY